MSLTLAFKEQLAARAAEEELVDAAYDYVKTPLGRLLVAQTPAGVCAIGFENHPDALLLARISARIGPRVVRSANITGEARASLQAYLEGERVDLPLPVDDTLVTSAFQRNVLHAAAGVRPGSVITYGRLALAIGHPRAARAVGTALARNPIPLLLPCHRVVPSTGGVGNYGGGADLKVALLRLEGAIP